MSNPKRTVYKRGLSSSSTDRFHVMPITMPRAPWEEGSEPLPDGNCVVVMHRDVIRKMKKDAEIVQNME